MMDVWNYTHRGIGKRLQDYREISDMEIYDDKFVRGEHDEPLREREELDN